MKVLYITNMYPNVLDPYSGIFVKLEVEHLRKKGLEVDVIFINGKKSKFQYIKSPFIIFHRLSKRKFDVINVQHSLLLPQTLLARKLLRLRTPVIYTFHEGEIGRKSSGTIVQAIFGSRKWKTAFIKYVDFVIARNAQILGDCGNTPVLEIPSPVNVEVFKPLDKAECRGKLSIEMNKSIIFFPADPAVPGKNFAFLKEIVEGLNKEAKQTLEILTGPIVPPKMPLYYSACDVVCLPSLYECSPVVIREAMACNRPIVASDVGDIGKTIGNVEGCFVASSWDRGEFCELILKALGHKETRSREKILDMGCDSETSTRKLIAVLERLTQAKSAQRGSTDKC